MEEFNNNGTPTMEEFQEDLKQLFEQYQVVKKSTAKVQGTLSELSTGMAEIHNEIVTQEMELNPNKKPLVGVLL
ncbi:MAG: hypothetical protein BZ138_07620 [Methanosphaera sp. rholeuAM270]|nr:MAG: hypothetical protein BZ138_07620 [Methanosphaera sp. rholeuAM270]